MARGDPQVSLVRGRKMRVWSVSPSPPSPSMFSVSLSLSLVLASSLFPAYAASVSPFSFLSFPSSPPLSALSGSDGHPNGHLGKTWEIAVGVSLGASPVCACVLPISLPLPGLLLCGAAITILAVTIRQRRRRLQQPHRSDYLYASNLPPASLPSMPYGISRVRRSAPSNLPDSYPASVRSPHPCTNLVINTVGKVLLIGPVD